MKILTVGSGGREHAIVRALSRETTRHDLHAAPGNPGIAGLAVCHPVAADDLEGQVDLARRLGADLVVVGPEAPLVAGLADRLRAAGIPVFGPDAAAARLEGSKSFAKDVMLSAGVPTGAAVTCTDDGQVEVALDRFAGAPYVVKADGLAAGKGVVVTTSRETAQAHATACLDQGGSVVLEEFLDGPEVSLFCLADGEHVVPLAPAQDFKRALDGDAGPNTGGMGAYSPLPWLPDGTTRTVVEEIAQPVIDELRRRDTPFQGLLYCGLAMTATGPKVIEFNARFGDPETQVVLERLTSPLSEALLAASTGGLGEVSLEFSATAAVTVVLASRGYPATSSKGQVISGVDRAEEHGCPVIHAGTGVDDAGELVTAGGRVLCVVGTGEDLTAARTSAYAGVADIRFDGEQFRTDIALASATDQARTHHPEQQEHA